MAAGTIDEVIAQLDGIVDAARERRDRAGYFAALYRNVTRRVRDGIAAGEFEDGARMERLDVTFANRYLSALEAFRGGGGAPRSWQVSFDANRSWEPLVLQQLLVGINAHINFDLGPAAAATAPGDELPSLRHDFDAINGILGGMLDKVKADVEQVSPWIRLLDRVDPSGEDAMINFGMDRARDSAWSVATRLAGTEPSARPAELDVVDRWTAVLGTLVLHPPGLVLKGALALIRARESNDVRRVIDVLCQV